MGKVYNFISSHLGILSVAIFALVSVGSLFHSGIFPTHDGEYHVIRFYEFDKTLRAGNLYPVWAPDLNYTFGSPLFNYVYPFPNYVSSVLHLFGVSFIDAFKANLILATISGAFFSYMYARNRFGVWGGVLTSVFYTFAPYHFLDIYIRGSVGEVWALAFFPLSLYFVDRIAIERSTRNVLLSGLVYSLIIFSHNILAVMFVTFSCFYMVLQIYKSKKKKATAFSLFGSLIIGFLVSSVFIVPALFEQKYVVGLKVFDPTQNFAELYQLLIPSWGSGFSGGGGSGEMSFQIGIANTVVLLLIILSFILKKIKKDRLYVAFVTVWFFVLCFLVTSFSSFLWKTLPIMDNFQFPWRFLSLLILCTAILAGSLTRIYKSRILYVFLIIICVLSTYSYAHAPYFYNRGDTYYTTRENFIYGTNSIGNVFQTKWLPQQEKLPRGQIAIESGNVIQTLNSPTSKVFDVSVSDATSIILNTAYFPGWTAEVDGITREIKNNHGKIEVGIPKGAHHVQISFQDTTVRLLAKLITIVSLMIIIILLLRLFVIQYFNEDSHR